QLSGSEQANAVPHLAQETGPAQDLTIDRLRCIEPARVDGGLQPVEVYDDEIAAEDVVEPALRQAHVERHLAALAALDAPVRARRLPLAAAAAGLTLPGADAAADPHAGLACAGVVGDLAQLHGRSVLCRPAMRRLPGSTPQIGALVLAFHTDQMLHLGDHAAHRRRVFQFAAAVPLVQPEADQRRPLNVGATDRAADLGHFNTGFLVGHVLLPRLGGVATAQDLAHLLAAAGGDGARRAAAAERRERRLHHVVRVRRTDRLRHDVVHAKRLEDRTDRPAGDDAGAGFGNAEDHAAGAEMPEHVVVQRAALAQRHADQPALRLFGRLADGLGHFARLAGAMPDPPLAIADHDQAGKAEPAPALHDLGNTIDADELFDQLHFVARPVAVTIPVAIAAV